MVPSCGDLLGARIQSRQTVQNLCVGNRNFCLEIPLYRLLLVAHFLSALFIEGAGQIFNSCLQFLKFRFEVEQTYIELGGLGDPEIRDIRSIYWYEREWYSRSHGLRELRDRAAR